MKYDLSNLLSEVKQLQANIVEANAQEGEKDDAEILLWDCIAALLQEAVEAERLMEETVWNG